MRCRDCRRREVERDRQCEKGVTKALLMAQAGKNECALPQRVELCGSLTETYVPLCCWTLKGVTHNPKAACKRVKGGVSFLLMK